MWWWWRAVRQAENAADFDPYPRALSRHRWSEAHPSTSADWLHSAHTPLPSTSGCTKGFQMHTAHHATSTKSVHKMPVYLCANTPNPSTSTEQQMPNISTLNLRFLQTMNGFDEQEYGERWDNCATPGFPTCVTPSF